MAKTRAARAENFEIPVWTEMPGRWYQQLNRLARKHGLTRREILEKSLRSYERALANESSPFRTVKASVVQEADAKQVFGKFSKFWWDSLTPAQRKVESKKRSTAAKKRWAKARGETE